MIEILLALAIGWLISQMIPKRGRRTVRFDDAAINRLARWHQEKLQERVKMEQDLELARREGRL
jgi:hypothetical protein